MPRRQPPWLSAAGSSWRRALWQNAPAVSAMYQRDTCSGRAVLCYARAMNVPLFPSRLTAALVLLVLLASCGTPSSAETSTATAAPAPSAAPSVPTAAPLAPSAAPSAQTAPSASSIASSAAPATATPTARATRTPPPDTIHLPIVIPSDGTVTQALLNAVIFQDGDISGRPSQIDTAIPDWIADKVPGGTLAAGRSFGFDTQRVTAILYPTSELAQAGYEVLAGDYGQAESGDFTRLALGDRAAQDLHRLAFSRCGVVVVFVGFNPETARAYASKVAARLAPLPCQGVTALIPTPTPYPTAFRSTTLTRTATVDLLPPQPHTFDDLSFRDRDHGWLAITQTLLTTDDAAATWQPLYQSPAPIKQVILRSATAGWLLREDGMFHTTDGGHTWTVVPVPFNQTKLFGLQVIDDAHWLVHIRYGTPEDFATMRYEIHMTADGGTTWTPLPQPDCGELGPIRYARFVTPTHGWLICEQPRDGGPPWWQKALLTTTDGGAHWTEIAAWRADVPDGGELSSGTVWTFEVIDADTLWIADFSPFWAGLRRSTDGGHTWTRTGVCFCSDNRRDYLADLAFVSPSVGYAIARSYSNDTVLRTEDGGATWAAVMPQRGPQGQAQFFSPSDGIGFGGVTSAGAVFRTANGGATWTQIGTIPNVDEDIEQLSFPEPATGWALDTCSSSRDERSSNLFQTTDGGASWVSIPLPQVANTNDFPFCPRLVSFASATAGYLSDGTMFFATSDGGASWQRRPDATHHMSSLQFTSPSAGWAVADGTLWATTDGAQTWQALPLAAQLTGISHPTAMAGFVVLDRCKPQSCSLAVTADAAQTWTGLQLPFDIQDELRITWLDAAHGWVHDRAGSWFRTADGGQTWRQLH